MAETDRESLDTEVETEALPRRFRRRWKLLGALLGVSVLGLAGAWLARKDIADRIVAGQLEDLGLPGSYRIESIGPSRQVLTNIVIGDPAHPDLTIERAVVEIVPSFGLPTIGKVTLLRPRLYGSFHDGKPSFGSLDKVLFRKTTKPFRLPDLDVALVDGRALIASDYGPVGMKAEGAGNLHDGFAGIVAAVAPKVTLAGCAGDRATLYGKITITAEQPRFAGPLRLNSLTCQGQGLALRNAAISLDANAPPSLDSVAGKLGLSTGTLAWQGRRLISSSGSSSFTLRDGDLTASYELRGKGISAGSFDAATLSIDGLLRSHQHFASLESEGSLSATGGKPGLGLDAALVRLQRSGEGTLVAPLVAQLRTALAREGAQSRLAASYHLRQAGGETNLVVPRAALRGSSGQDLFELSRFELAGGDTGGPRLGGNFVTGGPGLPHLEGRVERQAGGKTLARLSMAEYRAGDSRLAMPQLVLVQGRGGEVGISGQVRLSGAVPGGKVENLALPLDGNWSARRGLAAWRHCMPVSFENFAISSLTLDQRSVMLCPGREGAMVRADGRGVRISAGIAALALSGRVGTTPIRIASGPIGLAWPGTLAARGIDVALGGTSDPTTLKFAAIDGQLGKVMNGRFSGAEIKLNNVPLDVLEAQGTWDYADGNLVIGEGALRVEDRQVDDRFRPLIARDATLMLRGGEFTAAATLREPKSDREVAHVAIAHDMAKGIGHADLAVPGLVFDDAMQPDTLTALALGVIANAEGTVAGTGRIDWTPAGVSSTGHFSTDKLDFAAAFGPVHGTSGTVEFTDLLGLVTAPDQRLRIASINPGIEVNDGEVSFALQGNNVLMVNGAHWPFIDGTLELQPTRMVLGAAEVRRYTLKVDGINAAKFVERLEMSNISASGTFDGTLPLIFDQNGGRIEGGVLTSRPPGGNVSYVGQLTYKDLSPMANFAFQTLRSLDYRKMQIAMDGALEGEIITRVRFDGVRQGAGAKRNFITQRFAHLPIQFNLNIRAPFQRLLSSFRGLYDPSYVSDPRALGLLDANGRPITNPQESTPQKNTDIQPPVSRKAP